MHNSKRDGNCKNGGASQDRSLSSPWKEEVIENASAQNAYKPEFIVR